jgi:hypothetical protein
MRRRTPTRTSYGVHLRARLVREGGPIWLGLVCCHGVTHSLLWPDSDLEHGEAVRLLLLRHQLETGGCDCLLCPGCSDCGPARG